MVTFSQKIYEKYFPYSLKIFLRKNLFYKFRCRELKLSRKRVPLFKTVYFEIRTRCNSTCSFCAASIQNEKREDKTMPIEMYKKVILQLKKLNYSGRIAYHVNSDPLISSNLAQFVLIARNNLPKAWIQILTNGKALTLKKAEELLKNGINELSINYYTDNLESPIPEIFVKIKEEILPKYFNKSQIKRGFYTNNEDIFCFNIFKRDIKAILTTRAGTAPNKKFDSHKWYGFCEHPFSQFNITTDGRVNKCCADLYFSDPMGNVNISNLLEIWYGEKFDHVRNLLLKNNRLGLESCKECDYPGVIKIESPLFKLFSFFMK
ncbi:hypothetical protein LCGC14_1707930 [marine sediment metagenome]|uniref:4Fe4S-binding SPASM domain-containing protein n=1 Tax=marine sediment metagenome TaxID=412755 RepID=A0A0F9HGI1_9ZZZZ